MAALGKNSSLRGGFTLIEILTAAAVLTVLLVSVTQIVHMGQQASSETSRRIDTEQEARFVFNRMAEDFSRIILRPDVDLALSSADRNDSLAFYAEVPTYQPGRKLAILSYRSRPEGFQRGLRDLGPEGMAFLPRTLVTAKENETITPDTLLPDTGYDLLSRCLIRVEFLAVGKDGRLMAQWNRSAAAGIMVVFVALDQRSRDLLSDADLDDLASKFTALRSQSNTLMKDASSSWTEVIHSSTFQELPYPARVKQGIRVFQRFFPLSS